MGARPYSCMSDVVGGAPPIYWPMVCTTLFSGRVLFDDSLSCCMTISSYFGSVVSICRGTMCTTL